MVELLPHSTILSSGNIASASSVGHLPQEGGLFLTWASWAAEGGHSKTATGDASAGSNSNSYPGGSLILSSTIWIFFCSGSDKAFMTVMRFFSSILHSRNILMTKRTIWSHWSRNPSGLRLVLFVIAPVLRRWPRAALCLVGFSLVFAWSPRRSKQRPLTLTIHDATGLVCQLTTVGALGGGWMRLYKSLVIANDKNMLYNPTSSATVMEKSAIKRILFLRTFAHGEATTASCALMAASKDAMAKILMLWYLLQPLLLLQLMFEPNCTL